MSESYTKPETANTESKSQFSYLIKSTFRICNTQIKSNGKEYKYIALSATIDPVQRYFTAQSQEGNIHSMKVVVTGQSSAVLEIYARRLPRVSVSDQPTFNFK